MRDDISNTNAGARVQEVQVAQASQDHSPERPLHLLDGRRLVPSGGLDRPNDPAQQLADAACPRLAHRCGHRACKAGCTQQLLRLRQAAEFVRPSLQLLGIALNERHVLLLGRRKTPSDQALQDLRPLLALEGPVICTDGLALDAIGNINIGGVGKRGSTLPSIRRRLLDPLLSSFDGASSGTNANTARRGGFVVGIQVASRHHLPR
mmetsp:Transcript_85603/g.247260  ORF Transcript_85603/g.247260 Transcript_85603/m.247260 type:complete len:207 (+) Transcript_85603:140-760(+)